MLRSSDTDSCVPKHLPLLCREQISYSVLVNRCTSRVQSALFNTCVQRVLFESSLCMCMRVLCLHCRSRRVESERAAHCSLDASRGRRGVHRVRACRLRAAECPARHILVPSRRLSSPRLRCVFTFTHTHTQYNTRANTRFQVYSQATDMHLAQSAIWCSPTRARC